MLGHDRVVGQWDRVDQKPDASVVDYKSTAIDEGSDKPQQAANQDLQLRLYALAHEKMYGSRPAEAALHFLETGERGVIKPNDADMGVVRALVTSTAGKIRAKNFAADHEGREDLPQCPYHRSVRAR